ncbi:hypothetical protein [Aliiglaciecola lipolytica]|uniref:hypothetical protein n=1 Tax=Aliiglaciecola lipolytica TaxID=477689 RepID=UPI00058CF9DA|nr:hypothetical protein [Aliiglaciecola lipolytica]
MESANLARLKPRLQMVGLRIVARDLSRGKHKPRAAKATPTGGWLVSCSAGFIPEESLKPRAAKATPTGGWLASCSAGFIPEERLKSRAAKTTPTCLILL